MKSIKMKLTGVSDSKSRFFIEKKWINFDNTNIKAIKIGKKLCIKKA